MGKIKVKRIYNFIKLKSGDRILVLYKRNREPFTPIGNFHGGARLGKILEIKKYTLGYSILIEFDKDIGGHDGNQCLKKGKDGHCWWVSIDYFQEYAFFKLLPCNKRKHNFY